MGRRGSFMAGRGRRYVTKQKNQAILPKREPTSNQSGAPRIEVTPEMIEAGAKVLFRMDLAFGSEESFAEQVYVAMETAKLAPANR